MPGRPSLQGGKAEGPCSVTTWIAAFLHHSTLPEENDFLDQGSTILLQLLGQKILG